MFLFFRVVPVSKTRNTSHISLFVYYPILNLDQKILNYTDQISVIKEEENNRKEMFDATTMDINANTVLIILIAVSCITISALCVEIHCLKRKQRSIELRLLEVVCKHKNLKGIHQESVTIYSSNSGPKSQICNL